MLYKNSHAGSNQKSIQPKHLARGDGQILLLKAVCLVTVTLYKLLNKALNTHIDPRSMVAMNSQLASKYPRCHLLSQILSTYWVPKDLSFKYFYSLPLKPL